MAKQGRPVLVVLMVNQVKMVNQLDMHLPVILAYQVIKAIQVSLVNQAPQA